ncbi:MAG: hypothetical protein K1X47_15825 [Cyclobacteriaceae bacterium]|nr:hypothetical protein [Cyclobacteriaceae bacterium]
MSTRSIDLQELRQAHFPPHDVLTDPADRFQREHDLRSAMAVTNTEREEVGLIIRIASGDEVEYLSDMIELEGDFVEVRGGYAIPVKAILRVEI